MYACMLAACIIDCAGSSSSNSNSEGEERGGGNGDDSCRRRDEPASPATRPSSRAAARPATHPPSQPRPRVCIGGRDADADRWLPPPQTHSLTAPHSDSLQDRSNDLTACITHIYINRDVRTAMSFHRDIHRDDSCSWTPSSLGIAIETGHDIC
eukprot:GHVU01107747.1.p2 GENE.GHVU01107747.1~~GHVU01107747.1.p2  ORF type:complete len:154 (-),score=11.09 GHVU01107747.1:1097-1558(-)